MSNENDLYNTQSVVMTNPQPVVKVPLKNSNKIPVRITNRSKTDEVREFIIRNEMDLALITETWLKESVSDTVVDIPEFT